jgi:hypothetical protein
MLFDDVVLVHHVVFLALSAKGLHNWNIPTPQGDGYQPMSFGGKNMKSGREKEGKCKRKRKKGEEKGRKGKEKGRKRKEKDKWGSKRVK